MCVALSMLVAMNAHNGMAMRADEVLVFVVFGRPEERMSETSVHRDCRSRVSHTDAAEAP